jgi:DNA-binding PadR family transcriptional regulator
MSGWDLCATAEAVIGDFWSLTRSQVYRELAALAKAGLVIAGEAGSRERRPYRLTPAGRSAFRRWLVTEPGPEQIRDPLLLTMSFAGAGPDADPYTMATLDFGVRYERAVLEWFEALPPEITAGPTATVGERTRR